MSVTSSCVIIAQNALVYCPAKTSRIKTARTKLVKKRKKPHCTTTTTTITIIERVSVRLRAWNSCENVT